uniref:Uncharacterized protein n=1 Tax=Oryza brachyantha TaxID=4533 RepID=J3M0Z0_ORYBR
MHWRIFAYGLLNGEDTAGRRRRRRAHEETGVEAEGGRNRLGQGASTADEGRPSSSNHSKGLRGREEFEGEGKLTGEIRRRAAVGGSGSSASLVDGEEDYFACGL